MPQTSHTHDATKTPITDYHSMRNTPVVPRPNFLFVEICEYITEKTS